MDHAQQTRKKFTVLAVFVFLIAFAYIGGDRFLYNSSADSVTNLQSASSIGIDINMADFVEYPIDASSQNQRVSIVLDISNNSTKTLQISPGLQMQLIDSNGVSHSMTAKYNKPGHVIGGPLRTGNKLAETIDFDIPASVSPQKFIYQADLATQPMEIGL